MNREELIEVFKDTSDRVDRGEYKSELEFEKLQLSDIKLDTMNNNYNNVDVVNEDCIKVANRLSKLGKTCILNMASYKKPGGGVKTGAMAQEEELARRSNLMWGLPQEFYPLLPDEYIYTKGVTFFKDGGYNVIDEFDSDVITIAAINIREDEKPVNYRDIMYKKIINMLYTPYENGCKNLVLSAFGCGVFKNDPSFVSGIFLDMLSGGYASLYDNVYFAILNDANSVGSNFEIFKEVLSPNPLPLLENI